MADLTDKTTLSLTLGELNELLAWGNRMIASTQSLMSKMVLQAQSAEPFPAPPPAAGNGSSTAESKRPRSAAS